jgi:hypothetical protein
MLAGNPAILLAHDQETGELTETMRFPQLPVEPIQNIDTEEDLNHFLIILDDSFRQK